MKILSYNILNPYHAVKWRTAEGLDEAGQDNWGAWRAEAVLENLEAGDFDVICLQELNTENLAWLTERYELASHALHETDEPLGAHGTAVMYRPERVELVASYAASSGGSPERFGASADLRHKASGRVIRCLSVHLKGYNPYEEDLELKRASQRTGDQELARYVTWALNERLEGVDGLAILGDFNEDEREMSRESSRQAVLLERGFQWDGVCDVTETRTGRKIDWAFYRALSSRGAAQLHHARPQQRLEASDHALTGLSLDFK